MEHSSSHCVHSCATSFVACAVNVNKAGMSFEALVTEERNVLTARLRQLPV